MKNYRFGHQLSEINVTPFVDVVLVLLIIFMITAPLLSQGLDVELPEASAPALQRTEQDVTITMKKDGSMFVTDDPTPYTLEQIDQVLEKIFAHREKKELLLRADKKSAYGTVARAIALFKRIGIERVGLVTEEEKKKE